MTAVIEAPVVPVTPARRPSLWKHRDFRLLWFGESVSVLGNAISGIALPLVALELLHAGPLAVGLLGAASWLPWLVLGLPAGAWIDRLPRRPTMIIANVVSFVLVLSVPVAAWLGVLTLVHLLAVALLGGATGVFFSPAYSAYLPTLIESEDLGEGNAKLQGSAQVAVVSGSSIGGLLTQAMTAVLGLAADAITYVVSTVCLLAIRTKEPAMPKAAERTTTLRQEIRDGFRFLIRDPYLRIMTIGASVDNLLLTAGHTLLVVFLIQTVGASPGMVGLLLAADCAGGVLGAVIANKVSRTLGSARALLAFSLLTAPFGLLIPLTGSGPALGFFAAGLLIPAAGIVAVNVIGGAFRQTYCPPDMLGRISTSGSFIAFGLIPIGALLGGALGTFIGVRETLWIVLALGAVGKLILLFGPIRKTRDLPTAPANA
ncbi:MFS family permease [Allocatelliglobosispora scoriae]|uniref:MFS family permease n=1 Tax=Allocatelliglobosispora scoriae TaxID=643052 RepID=A0A841BJK3_9ACTN|nr:MFS transporter [Allocatelliglobosispora scoriae]MBB5867081.1 MFS family permease [Allocatelliglobosispora scoriae]